MTTGIPRKLEAAGCGPAPWAPRKAQAGVTRGKGSNPAQTAIRASPKTRGLPSMACTPRWHRGWHFRTAGPQAGAGRTLHTQRPRRCHPGGARARGGWGFPRHPRAEGGWGGEEGGFATIPLGGGSRGSGGGGGGWRRRLRRRRRRPGTPPPIVPSPGQARPRAPRRVPRPGPRRQPLPCSARPSPCSLKATYPGKARSRGARERTHRQKVKLRQGWSGCWLVPFPLLPSHRPHPLPSVSRAVP